MADRRQPPPDARAQEKSGFSPPVVVDPGPALRARRGPETGAGRSRARG